MCFNLNMIRTARMNVVTHEPKTPNKSTGIKWAIAAAVAILAMTILTAVAAVNFTMAGLAFAAGAIPGGILSIGGGIMVGLSVVSIGFIAKECILNARHHLNPPPMTNLNFDDLLSTLVQ